ncbi:hypothetical protein LZ30DRAFT_134149 [Colletotrichum cereale]|nr:hypothetical protein LZ30DRAFT_134149 [Colletotrichum cereale]
MSKSSTSLAVITILFSYGAFHRQTQANDQVVIISKRGNRLQLAMIGRYRTSNLGPSLANLKTYRIRPSEILAVNTLSVLRHRTCYGYLLPALTTNTPNISPAALLTQAIGAAVKKWTSKTTKTAKPFLPSSRLGRKLIRILCSLFRPACLPPVLHISPGFSHLKSWFAKRPSNC